MSRIRHVFGKALVGAALALSVALPPVAAASTPPGYEVIYNFTGGADGALPYAGLIRDAAGNFYGTASIGGDQLGVCSPSGCGVVFKLSPRGVETPLYTFTGGSDGGGPYGGLVADAAGNLYGTTNGGGASGLGVVFKVTQGGQETVLHSFAGGSDGANPLTGMIMDEGGNLYGTTHDGGGASSAGTVFKLSPDGTETVLHAFTGADGDNPNGVLVMDRQGNLFGDTSYLGAGGGEGTIFKIAPNGKFSVLHAFTGGARGGGPYGGLLRDGQGNLYGATSAGGHGCNCGVVFKLAPDGTFTVLHTFTDAQTAAPQASLIMDKAGNLYGTASGARGGLGVVFQISPDGTETVLHSFGPPPDGANSNASLTKYMNRFYGTTTHGGTGTVCFDVGCGTVFEVRKAK